MKYFAALFSNHHNDTPGPWKEAQFLRKHKNTKKYWAIMRTMMPTSHIFSDDDLQDAVDGVDDDDVDEAAPLICVGRPPGLPRTALLGSL